MASIMVEALGSSTETQRLQLLQSYRVLNPAPSPTLEGVVRLAATLCDVPIAFVGFFDAEHQVFKAATGCPELRIPHKSALCTLTIAQTGLFSIADLQQRPEFRKHPMLRVMPGIRFYAGVPLISPEGIAIGTLALMDRQPRNLTDDQADGLFSLAGLILSHLNEQKNLQELRQIQRQQEKSDVELSRHSLIFDHIHDGLLVLDLGGRIIDCNPGASNLFGWSKAELFGKTIQCLHSPTSENMRSLAVVKAILNEKSWQAEDLFVRKDGTTGNAKISAVPLQSRGGQTIGILVIYHDISDRRLAELAWEHQKVALQAAERAAQEANKAKGEFLAMMSHEIRTPMNAVIGMTGLLQETPLSPEQRDFVDTIYTAGEALLTIVNQVLDFSKLESGNFELESYSFDLPECVENVLDLLAAKALEKGVGLFYRIAENVPMLVEGDGNRLRQILLNLLSNALKFTDKGEVTVAVSRVEPTGSNAAQALEQSNLVMVQFAVKDTGIGISAEQQAAIFRPYAQAEVSTARTYGGTGLGLSISRRLTELMGGKLWVKSSVGEGSTFFFTIAFRQVERSKFPLVQDIPLTQLEGKRLLVLDRNVIIQQFVRHQAQQFNMIAYSVSSPTEALNHLRHGDPIDMVFLDWDPGEMDSFHLARQMHSLPDYQQLPIILLHSLDQEQSPELSDRWTNQIEFVGRLSKPLKHKSFKNILLRACHSSPSVAVAAAQSLYDRSLGQRYPLRILLAEDNLTNQKVISQILYRLGYTTDIANNGYEVLQKLEQSPYDLILMDLNMPDLDGWETTRQICNTYSLEKCPRIVALTAHAFASVETQCRETGMHGYLTKPIRVPDLTQVLQNTAVHKAEQQVKHVEEEQAAIDIFGLQTFIRDLAGEDWNFLQDLVEAYIHDSDQYVTELMDYLAAPTTEQKTVVERIIHTLKSSSHSMFALPLSTLCHRIEHEWLSYDRTQQCGALETLIQEYQRAKTELQTFIHG
ncbi:MAG: response regulator [Prochlorotrichaceae cyanobacterium]